MKKTYSLSVEKRLINGHKVKHLRKEGKIPASVYGHGFESTAIVVSADSFKTLYKEAGSTNLVNLSLEGTSVPVLIHFIQKHPVTQQVIHVEFLKVNLKEKLKTTVPVSIIGESAPVAQGEGTLLTVVQNIEIEALPNNIPESLVVDVTSLTAIDQELKVKDLIVPNEVTVLTDLDQTLVKVVALTIEEEPVAPEAPPEGETTTESVPETEASTKTSEADKTE